MTKDLMQVRTEELKAELARRDELKDRVTLKKDHIRRIETALSVEGRCVVTYEKGNEHKPCFVYSVKRYLANIEQAKERRTPGSARLGHKPPKTEPVFDEPGQPTTKAPTENPTWGCTACKFVTTEEASATRHAELTHHGVKRL
jgi:hypothetical protein